MTRKQKLESDKLILQDVARKKPLFQLYEERYQEDFVAKDLEEQKKILQTKRSLQNQIPAGHFRKVFEDHDREYMMRKHEKSEAILEKRNQDRL